MATNTYQASALMTRAAAARTVDVEARTVEFWLTTGATVKRYSWLEGEYLETIDLDGADLSRAVGAPVCISHRSDDLGAVVGVIEKVWREEGGLVGLVRFSRRPEAEAVLMDIKDGIFRQGSIGASVEEYELRERDGVRELIARKWTFLEYSIVPIGADPGAVVRSLDAPQTVIVRSEDSEVEPEAEQAQADGASGGADTEEQAETEQVEEAAAPAEEAPAAEPAVEQSAEVEDPAEVSAAIVEMAMKAGCPDMAASLIRSKASKAEAEARITEFGGIKRSVEAARRAYPGIITQAVATEAMKAGGIDLCRKMLFERLVAVDAATEISNSITPRQDELPVENSEKKFSSDSIWSKKNAATQR